MKFIILNPNIDFINKISKLFNKNSKCFFNNFGLGNKETKLKYYHECQSFVNRELNLYNNKNISLFNIKTGEYYCNENNIKYIDFLKIDSEGYELNILKGFGEMIKNIKIIQFEYGQIDKSIKFKDIIEYLKINNFTNFCFLDKNCLVPVENYNEPEFCNVVCFNNKKIIKDLEELGYLIMI